MSGLFTRKSTNSRRESRFSSVQVGLIGSGLVVLLVFTALNLSNLPFINSGEHYTAAFAEAGGLQPGDEVLISGAKVGKVTATSLAGDHVTITFTVDNRNVLGDETTASINTVTLLGRAALEPVPAGSSPQSGEIPLTRTTSPYNITQALGDLTTHVAAIDKPGLSVALATLADSLKGAPASLRQALEGLDTLSGAISSSDSNVRDLMSHTRSLSGVLAARNQQVAQLLTSGNDVLTQLTARQELVHNLLVAVQQLTTQAQGLIRENDSRLEPTLRQLTALAGLLQKNESNLNKTLAGARNYAIGFGEAVSSGPFFDAYVQNLLSPTTLSPGLFGATK